MTRGEKIAAVLAAAGVAVGLAQLFRGGAPADSASTLRARVVGVARSQVGKAELERYFAAVAPQYVGERPEWCGIFALWCLHEAGLAAGVQWVVARGFLFHLPRTSAPQPGDIAYYTKNQHEAVVVAVRDGEVDLVNGNGSGGVVTESTSKLESANAYFSIQPWIDAALKREAT